MEAKSLLLVLELDHLAGLEKALQSHRGERIIFYGPSKLRARTGKSIGHGTQVGVKAGRFCVDQLVDRAARIVGEVLCSILMTFPSAKSVSCQTQNYLRIVQRYLRMVENFAMLHYSLLQRAPPENHCVLTQPRWPLRSNCCPAVQFDGGADRSLLDSRGARALGGVSSRPWGPALGGHRFGGPLGTLDL